MTWLLMLVSLTFCLTVGLTARYKEQIADLKQDKVDLKEKHNEELEDLLRENVFLRDVIKRSGIEV